MQNRAGLLVVAMVLAGTLSVTMSAADSAQTPAKAAPVVVLDTLGMWRMHQTLKPPVIRTADGVKSLLLHHSWMDRDTTDAPADWTRLEFDDQGWLRGSAHLASSTAYQARLCLRGKFTVTDPAQVRGLKVTVAYEGGAAVYVNGQEVGRKNLAAGAALAEDYPGEAFLNKDGSLLLWEEAWRDMGSKDPRRQMMGRTVEVAIPSRLLRAGVNVVAVEIVRSAYPKVVDEKKNPKSGRWVFAWNTCQLDGIEMTADTAAGLVPNVVRPAEFEVWNSDLVASDYDLDYGDPNEQVATIRISGARNGTFSGKVVAGSAKAIRGLKATTGELVNSTGGTIAASRVQVRYGFPWGNELNEGHDPYPYAAQAGMLGGLESEAPAEVPVRQKYVLPKGGLKPVFGAVAPVWVTVQVPKDAKAGTYTGAVTISAEGEKAVRVPVQLKVADWTLPNPEDYRTMVEMLQSPDTLAMEYKTPLWSDRHWQLLAESFKLMAPSGSRFLYIPLIAETNFGYSESMVRWIKKGAGYEYDFSVMDKYLDTAAKNLGTPKVVVLYLWDVYMLQKVSKTNDSGAEDRIFKSLEEKKAVRGQGPIVTVLDPKTGQTENVTLPRYGEAGSKETWQPLLDEVRRHLAARGLEKTMMLGMLTDAWPTKAEVEFFAGLSPGTPWVIHSHGGNQFEIYGVAKVGYQVGVWGITCPGEKSLMGWKRAEQVNRYCRMGEFDGFPNSMWRNLADFCISGDQRGVGRLGAEFWPVLRDKKGQRAGRIYERYPFSNWRNLDIYTSLFAPGAQGPAATQHYVLLVEGVQECEARIVVERALGDPAQRSRLGEELAGRCQAALDERLHDTELDFCMMINRFNGDDPGGVGSTFGPGVPGHIWNIASGWEERTEALFALAGEVERKLGGN
jgi:hypothetical protein